METKEKSVVEHTIKLDDSFLKKMGIEKREGDKVSYYKKCVDDELVVTLTKVECEMRD